jgi:hypothetical protein
MTADEIKNLAVKLQPMPEGLNAAEQLYFVTMRTLSADYRAKRMSAAQARKESLEAKRAFEGNAFNIKLWNHTAQLWKNIEMTAIRFAKEHTMEAADEFFRTVYGLGENWRAVRPLKEITEEENNNGKD